MTIEIVEKREVPGLGTLFLAAAPKAGGPARDQPLVEFVDAVDPGVPKAAKWVITVSTQLGCPVGCAFCDAGSLGFHGNLPAEALLAQVRAALEANPGLDPRAHPRIKLHFARMGEPTLNPAVLEALEALGSEPWPGLMPSVSTIAPRTPAALSFLDELAGIKDRLFRGRFQLQFSIHATEAGARRSLVPVRSLGLEELAAYGPAFVKEGDRKITLNFAFDSTARPDPEPVVRLFDPGRFFVKLTPVNPTRRARASGFSPPWREPPPAVAAFAGRLREAGFETRLNLPAPVELETGSSCGQLWSRRLAERGERLDRSLRRLERAYVRPETLEGSSARWERELEPFRRRRSPPPEALVVLDLQELFLDPASPAFLPEARVALGPAVSLARAFKAAGRPVFLVTHADDEEGELRRWWRTRCAPDSRGARLARPLEGLGERLVKSRYSAFAGTRLEERLREVGVRSIALAGVATHLCVESTARDAFARDFSVSVALDATAGQLEELHVGSLKSMAWGVADVRRWRELIPAAAPIQEPRESLHA